MNNISFNKELIYLASNNRFFKIGISKDIQPRLHALNSRYVDKNRQFRLLLSFYPIVKAKIIENFLFDCCCELRELGEFYEPSNIILNCFDWMMGNVAVRSSLLKSFPDCDFPSYVISESKNSFEVIQKIKDDLESANYPFSIEISKKTKRLCDQYPTINNWYL